MNIDRITVTICLFAALLYAVNIVLEFAVSQSISTLSVGGTSAMVGVAAIVAKRERVKEGM